VAVRAVCPSCAKRFSAPEDYVGKKVDCPKCEARFVLTSPEEAERRAKEEAEREREREEDRKRLALIERQELRGGGSQSGQTYLEKFGTGVEPVRHFDPRAPSRFLRMRALSDWLLVSAYLALVLVLAGAGLTVVLSAAGVLPSVTVLVLCLVGWALLGTVLYCGLKTLGELAFLLSDLGDQQNDLVHLLLDIRVNTDRRVQEKGAPETPETPETPENR
jgi:hypothetical protein